MATCRCRLVCRAENYNMVPRGHSILIGENSTINLKTLKCELSKLKWSNENVDILGFFEAFKMYITYGIMSHLLGFSNP